MHFECELLPESSANQCYTSKREMQFLFLFFHELITRLQQFYNESIERVALLHSPTLSYEITFSIQASKWAKDVEITTC